MVSGFIFQIDFLAQLNQTNLYLHSRHWELDEYCRKIHDEYDAKGLVHLKCTVNAKLEEMTTELVQHRIRMLDILNGKENFQLKEQI